MNDNVWGKKASWKQIVFVRLYRLVMSIRTKVRFMNAEVNMQHRGAAHILFSK